MTCSILKCRSESVLRYEPLKIDMCEKDWRTFAELPLREGLAWLDKKREKQLTLEGT